jgi:hypothetical protein
MPQPPVDEVVATLDDLATAAEDHKRSLGVYNEHMRMVAVKRKEMEFFQAEADKADLQVQKDLVVLRRVVSKLEKF